MATTFKTLTSNDVTTTRTLLHEAIPMTGSLVSGTYGGSTVADGSEPHIKNYSHGMFQSVYDYSYLSSSANHVFDITVGYSSASLLREFTLASAQKTKKINLYNQMAQVLVGHSTSGSIREFDPNGDLTETGDTKMRECIFLNFARLLTKDEIKKGSFELQLGVGSYRNPHKTRLKITDVSGSDGYLTNSPAGEYGILYATASATPDVAKLVTVGNRSYKCGLIFYQAGVAVISGSVFMTGSGTNDTAFLQPGGGSDSAESPNIVGSQGVNGPPEMITGALGGSPNPMGHHVNFADLLTGSTIQTAASAIRHRIFNLQFNNTTELNSTIYFCRANHNDFNYSSNPTYLTGSKIRVKTSTVDSPVSYITTVGMYSADNELLAVAKLSEPLKKTPETELTLRVRLDY